MRGIALVPFVTAALCLSTTAAAGASSTLMKDGGFEKPVVGAGSFQGFSTGQTFSRWTVIGASGNVDIVSGTFTQNGFTFPAKARDQWLDLTGVTQTATGVAQTIPTTPGATYSLRFWVGNIYNPGGIFGVASTVDVMVNGSQGLVATNSGGKGKTSLVWKRFTVTVTATSGSTVIALINGDPGNDTANGLDAVSFIPIP
jgi:hypothetical protein